ncbi:MAG TPA: protein translocase subunit SecD, partial [Burkholderiaceae bacterium]|nr:protein translocase subunit SecD [Burkholderiaceae bacterium]
MNRYPLWKYLMVLAALAIGLLYTLPNFFGESPAVQVAGAKSTVKVDNTVLTRVEEILARSNITPTGAYFEQNGPIGTVRVRFDTTDVQLKAKDIIEKTLNPDPQNADYTVALNLLPASPNWLSALGAHPMYLGLDLRGGVHFLLQVDMKGALTSRYDSLAGDARNVLRDAKLPSNGVERSDMSVVATFPTADERDAAASELRRAMPDMVFTNAAASGGQFPLTGKLTTTAQSLVQTNALKQNINTLHNRINELGVAEPIIQQQGADRIVVQLPGVQDVAKAKEILGRTATLEIRMVDDSPSAMAALNAGTVPFGLERYTDRDGRPLLLRRQVILTGENLQDAQPGRDQQTQQPSVNLTLDSKGARIFRDVTRNNINKRMAIVLFEQGKGEVVTAPVIRSEIPGGQVQITGSMSAQEAADTALLLRAGALAAPMEIIEERTIGPSLGADNIKQGFDSTLYGFLAIVVFIILYYHMMGLFSALGLTFNVLLLL